MLLHHSLPHLSSPVQKMSKPLQERNAEKVNSTTTDNLNQTRNSGCLNFKDMGHLVKAKVVDGGECEGELNHFLGEIQITKLEIC